MTYRINCGSYFNRICPEEQEVLGGHRGGCKGRKSGHEPHKRGLNTKIYLAVDAHGMPIRAIITAGTVADCTQAASLIDGLTAAMLLADKGYDSNAILEQALSQGMQPVIPPKKSQRSTRVRQGNLQAPASSRECVLASQALARHRHPLCQKYHAIPRCSPDSMHRLMEQTNLTTLAKPRLSCFSFSWRLQRRRQRLWPHRT